MLFSFLFLATMPYHISLGQLTSAGTGFIPYFSLTKRYQLGVTHTQPPILVLSSSRLLQLGYCWQLSLQHLLYLWRILLFTLGFGLFWQPRLTLSVRQLASVGAGFIPYFLLTKRCQLGVPNAAPHTGPAINLTLRSWASALGHCLYSFFAAFLAYIPFLSVFVLVWFRVFLRLGLPFISPYIYCAYIHQFGALTTHLPVFIVSFSFGCVCLFPFLRSSSLLSLRLSPVSLAFLLFYFLHIHSPRYPHPYLPHFLIITSTHIFPDLTSLTLQLPTIPLARIYSLIQLSVLTCAPAILTAFPVHIFGPTTHFSSNPPSIMPSKRAWKPSCTISTLSAHTVSAQPTLAPISSPQYFFVIDSSIPFHFINDCSLFTTFTPVHKVFHSNFGSDIAIKGHGIVPLYFMAFGQLHGFTSTCAYAPSIPNHLYSSIATTKHGHQLLLSSRSPQLLISAKHRQERSTIPKYLLLIWEVTHFILPFHPIPHDASQALPFPVVTPLPPVLSQDSAPVSSSSLDSAHAPVSATPSISSRWSPARTTLQFLLPGHNPYSLSAFPPHA